MYEINPFQGFDDIKFGDESAIIEKIMKTKPRKLKKGPFAINETDRYDGFFVYYDKDGKCEAIEFYSNAKFKDVSFFDEKYCDVEAQFRNIDSDIKIDEVGFTSKKFGIGVYAPNKDENDAEVESVIIFRQGYYD